MKFNNLSENVVNLLSDLGEDPVREGLKETPERVVDTYEKIFEGYDRSLSQELTVFDNTYGYDDIVYSGRINFFSTCEHHLLPFFGIAHIGYIPDQKIVGLSKLARAVDIYARRLQDQERLTVQIADALNELLEPKAVAVILDAQHLCNMARGVSQVNSVMKTVVYRGAFKDHERQAQFMDIIKV